VNGRAGAAAVISVEGKSMVAEEDRSGGSGSGCGVIGSNIQSTLVSGKTITSDSIR